MILHTERLRLEPCAMRHYDAVRAINCDPEVMRFVGGVQSEDGTREWIALAESRWAERGFGWWVLRLPASDDVAGLACLQHIEHDRTQEHEIGWRLARAWWGQGLATEAARAVIGFAFDELGLARVHSIADPDNAASLAVMRRLGMRDTGRRRHYGADCQTYLLEKA